jgi:protein O-GlcNAc transferase
MTSTLLNDINYFYKAKKYDKVEELCLKILKDNNKNYLCWKYLAAIYKLNKKHEQALHCLQILITLPENISEDHNNLGNSFKLIGKFQEAINSYKTSIDMDPLNISPFYNIALLYLALNNLEESEFYFNKALLLNPENSDVLCNLGLCLKFRGHLYESIAYFEKAIFYNPLLTEAYNNLATVLKDCGQIKDSILTLQKCLDINPNFQGARSNLLLSLNYLHDKDYSYSFNEAIVFGEVSSENVKGKVLDTILSNNSFDFKIKPIKVGFVSGDIRNHPVGYFIESIFSLIDKNKFHIYIFSNSNLEDDLTIRIKEKNINWCNIYDMDDQAAANLIHSKKINILFDLAGHTAHNRLQVFSYKPAPIQVSWLGYFSTTGVKEIDYILGDPYVTPFEENSHFIEKVFQLPFCYLCFTRPVFNLLVNPLPFFDNGYITFGCFNSLNKINDSVILLWSKILKIIPNSKLFLKNIQFSDNNLKELYLSKFQLFGINKAKLIFEGPDSRYDYLKAYNRVDIALDPFPFPGGTTTVEGLWMGIPCITKKGNCFISHNGESIAHNSGQSEWIAFDDNDYLNKAMYYSLNPDKLAFVRLNLRKQIENSVIMNANLFTYHFESALTEMLARETDKCSGGKSA